MDSLVAFITSTRTRTSYSLQSVKSSCASFSKTAFEISTVSQSSSSTDTVNTFAMATSVGRLTLEFPVSILLTCCGLTPILFLCQIFLYSCNFNSFSYRFKIKLHSDTLLSNKLFFYIVTFVKIYYNGLTK